MASPLGPERHHRQVLALLPEGPFEVQQEPVTVLEELPEGSSTRAASSPLDQSWPHADTLEKLAPVMSKHLWLERAPTAEAAIESPTALQSQQTMRIKVPNQH
jgi:hypothetical protein